MKKYLIIVLVTVLNFGLKAQKSSLIDSIELKNYALQLLTGEKYNDPGHKHLNIYFKDYWIPGTVVLSNGQLVNDLSLKYNDFTNQLIMLNDKVGQIKIDNPSVSEFYLNDKDQIYHFKKVKIDTLNLNNDNYYQFIFSKKIDVYVYRKAKTNAINYRDDGMYTIYMQKPVYILIINKRTILINTATQKAIYSQFPNLKEQIKQRTRAKYKKIRTEIDFFNFLNDIEDILVDSIH